MGRHHYSVPRRQNSERYPVVGHCKAHRCTYRKQRATNHAGRTEKGIFYDGRNARRQYTASVLAQQGLVRNIDVQFTG